MKKVILVAILLFAIAMPAMAHQPRLVNGDPIYITEPDISRAYYDELDGKPRDYFITSDEQFVLYINLLVPKNTNPTGKYSANIYSIIGGKKELLKNLDGERSLWSSFYEEFGREYYFRGPEYEALVPAGNYEIEIYSKSNTGKYVLAIGTVEAYPPIEVLRAGILVPWLKFMFFKSSILGALFTPIGSIPLILFIILVILIILIREIRVRRRKNGNGKKNGKKNGNGLKK